MDGGGARRRIRTAAIAATAILAGATTTSSSCMRVVDAVQPGGCAAQSGAAGCSPTTGWPIDGHGANSDPWIVDHHDSITQMSPRVLVLNFSNSATADGVRQTAERQAAAIAEGSRYHGYADPTAPVFLNYQVAKVVDLADHPVPVGWNNPSSTQLPVTGGAGGNGGSFDAAALFTSRYTDLYGFPDPANPSVNLSLCAIFEQGYINEVWIEDGESGARHAPFNAERKQTYDAQNQPVAGVFDRCAGGGCLDVGCAVTVRIAHLDAARGVGCDLYVRGWSLESMWDALPAFRSEALAFLNFDFDTRFGMRFGSWYDVCDLGGTTCVTYPTPTSATGTYQGTPWTIGSFVQGCGNTSFGPSSRARYDFRNPAPVQSRCEHFGLHDGVAGADTLAPFTTDKLTAYERSFGDCGGGWQIYWRQSIPGVGNRATTATGLPQRNWWPLLFY